MTNSIYIPIWVACIIALPGLLSAILTYVTNYQLRREAVKTHQKLDVLQEQTNGLTMALVKATGKVEFQKGIEQGVQDQKDIQRHTL